MGEYEDFVKRIPSIERVPEPFNSIDNRLDFIGPKIIDIKNRVQKLEDILATLDIEGVAIMPKDVEQMPFSRNLTPLQVATIYEHPPFSGYIKQVTIHWPSGCNALVDVRIGHGNKQFCPDIGYLALDDATPTYQFNEYVRDDEEVWVEMRNADGVNNHAITCTITIEGAK